MITRIKARNFKSLADFELSGLQQFICLIGLNGSGKTTLLQYLDFVGHLVAGNIQDWLAQRGWQNSELLGAGCPRRSLEGEFELQVDNIPLIWNFAFNVDSLKCTTECLKADRASLLTSSYANLCKGEEPSATQVTLMSVNNGVCTVRPLSLSLKTADYKYTGSVFSLVQLRDEFYQKVVNVFMSLKSLELMAPATLRRASRENEAMGIGGEGLAGFLFKELKSHHDEILKELQGFYPELQELGTRGLKAGWKVLRIRSFEHEVMGGHVSDGLLRVLAILLQQYTPSSFLLFDEIENGINQELIEKLLDMLQKFSGKQVMVTTHSALVLNYLSDGAARDCVVFLYKDHHGWTHARRFFDLPEPKQQLEFMGPGEVMSQMNLRELSEQLANEEDEQNEKEIKP